MILGKESTAAMQMASEGAGDIPKDGAPFVLRDSYTRLCVSHTMRDELLRPAHNNQHHFGIERMMKGLLELYIHNLTRAIKKHIVSLQPRPSADTPQALEGYPTFNTLMTVTCSTSKQYILILGPSTYLAATRLQASFDSLYYQTGAC